ncbi:restriction endonuclease subunit S [Streptomyces sp. YIM 98790]|uniref:restriction endonuclease subunit S n=1 Tax=Streptomyces sp. YIM 98790 TaxID=2689077 RepID=UPI00140D8B6E|nr:restriction endonuclease subunit S [Streptomyces sp. YIM 98790]
MTENVRLRHLARINPPCPRFDRLSADAELTFLPMECIWPGQRLDLTHRRVKSAVAAGFTRFQDGDVLVPKITPTFEAGRAVLVNGLHNGVGAGTTELHVLRAGPRIDPRFLFYLVNTHSFLKFGEAEMYGVAGQQRVPDGFLRNLPVRVPDLEEQCRIADFLDLELAHIGRLDEVRARQSAVVPERLRAALDGIFAPSSCVKETRLKYLFSVRPRYGVLVPHFTDEGVPFIRVNDLLDLPGRIKDVPKIPVELSRQYSRTVVRRGDVLMSVVGTLGRVAIAPEEVAGANIARAVASLRVHEGVSSRLLTAWIKSSAFEEQAVRATASDTAQPTLGMEDLGNFRVRWPLGPREQDHMVREALAVESEMKEMVRLIEEQRRLLTERRQALITAAVTGQMDVTTARGVEVS